MKIQAHANLMACQNVTMLSDSYVKHISTTVHRAPDKRGIEDNSNIIFLIFQQKHML